MDTELARTFLTVVATGNFVSAAERLHVTQSTVSARIHALEEQLGCTLFVRNKAGTTLTPAGRQFQKHASTLVRTVEQARLREDVLTSDREEMARQRGTPERSPGPSRRERRLKVARKGGSS